MKSPVDLYLAAKKAEFLLLTFQIQSDYDSLNGSTSNGSSNSSDSNSDTVNEDEGSSTLNPMAKIVATDKEHENGPITTAIDNSKRKLSVASTDSSPTKKPRHLQNTRESVIEQYSMALEAFKKQELQSSELCHLLYDYGSFVENPDLFDQAYEIISNLEKQEDDYLLMGKILLQQAYYKLDNNGMFNDSIVIEAIDMFKKAGNDESSKITIARQLLDHALLKKSKLQDDYSGILSILKLCSNYCQNVDNVDSYRINGCSLFHIANIQSHSNAEINPHPLAATKKSIQLLEKVLSEEEELIVSDYQLLSHALLLQSSLEQDDEVAIELYDKAGEYLHVALEMDPNNQGIKQQLVDMGDI